MSTMANERNTTAEGLKKHILAHEAHKGIDNRLLALRKEDNDNAVDVALIYDKVEDLQASNNGGSSALGLSINSNGTKNNYVSFDFASKFTVRGSSGVDHSSSKSATSGVKSSKYSSKHSSQESTGSTSKKFFSSNASKHSRRTSRHSSVASCESVAEDAPGSTAEIPLEVG